MDRWCHSGTGRFRAQRLPRRSDHAAARAMIAAAMPVARQTPQERSLLDGGCGGGALGATRATSPSWVVLAAKMSGPPTGVVVSLLQVPLLNSSIVACVVLAGPRRTTDTGWSGRSV